MINKRAIFLCGSGGSGKSTIYQNYFSDYVVVDVDILYEKLLNEYGLGLDIKNFNFEQIELSNSLFEKAKQLNNEKFNEYVSENKNIVVDGVGRDVEVILNQRNLLEKCGYTTYMIMVYADIDVCIERVENRNRSYSKRLVIDSWHESYRNISEYKEQFKDRFLLVHNDEINDWKSKFQIFINKQSKNKAII